MKLAVPRSIKKSGQNIVNLFHGEYYLTSISNWAPHLPSDLRLSTIV